MPRAAADVEMATSDEDAGSSEVEQIMVQKDRVAKAGAFILGFGLVMMIAGVFAVFTRVKQSSAGSAERSLEIPDTELVPAISSSVGLPNLDPPPGMSMDAEFGAVVGVSSMPTVEKVNVGSLPYGHPSPSFEYPKYSGFTLWLVEEFNAPIDLDTDAIWTYSDGGLSEGQVRFVKDAITFQEGKMRIEMSNRGLPQGSQCSHAEVGYVGHKPLTSGEFRTRYNMYRYGRYEMRMKAPSVQKNNPGVNGNFISTMFVYRDAKFRHWREIDFEITADQKNAVTANVLKADHTSTWNGGIQSSTHMFPKGLDVRSEFHNYAFQWLPDKITWWIDDKIVREYKGGRVAIPDMSTKIMMNLWTFTGGGFGGSQAHNNQYPMHSEYDWFRFYKWDGDKQYPCLAMDQTCLTDDDKYLAGNNPCDGIDQHGELSGKRVCSGTCKRFTSSIAA